MSAITGNYRPASNVYSQWALTWLYRGQSAWSRNRSMLASQLLQIRREHGAGQAVEFRNYMLWLGTYPIRLRTRK